MYLDVSIYRYIKLWITLNLIVINFPFVVRIPYCSANGNYNKVVAFIATNENETLACHAFLTQKTKVAQACGKLLT